MKKKILFVDDAPRVLESLQVALQDQADKWDMTYTTNTDYATELLAQKQYDAVVLDIKMPGKNGLEMLTEIKADDRTRDIEVIMLTGLQDQNLKRQSLALGATDLLNKPIYKEELIARLNSVLNIKSYRDELQAQNALLERQLLQSQKMELIGILTSGVVHYLNGILSAIMMDSDFAQSLTDNPEVQENLKSIKDTSQLARQLLKQIHGFSRQTEAEYQLCNLGSIVDGCLELLRFYIPGWITIKWDGPQTDRFVQADETKMYQMLMNLCINAALAMGEENGVLRISLTETKLNADTVPFAYEIRPGPYVKLEISDTAARMEQTALERIFEPLSITAGIQEEIGLGLPVAQRIARNHGGLITVESTPGKENAFIVYLPCA